MLATGGPGIVFGRSTNSIINTGTAAGRAYLEGAIYANGEFIQVHPTSIPGEDKLRLMSESVRGEGGRVWVPKKKGDTRDPLSIPEERALVLPRGEVPQVQEPGPPRRRHPGDLPRLPRAGHGHRRARRRLPRRHAHPGLHARREDQGRDGDLREVRRRRSAPPSDGHLPGHALLDGRPVRDLRARAEPRAARGQPEEPGHQHPRPLRLGRGGLRVPRREPARRQLAPLLHLRRDDRRAGDGQLREEQRQELHRGAGDRSSRTRRSSGPSASPASTR